MNKNKVNRFQILSGSWLKIIAMISMFVDHYAMIILAHRQSAHSSYFTIGKYAVSDYFICRNIIGRIAFPIFAFLLVEGYKYTKNRRQYALNLLIFAILSIIPWNLTHSSLFQFTSFNVLFTLFFGVVGMYLIDEIIVYYKVHSAFPVTKTVLLVLGLIGIRFLRLDYGAVGVAYIIILHLLQDNRLNQLIATLATFTYNRFHQFNFLAYIPISLYNGERGFINGKWGKYIMYAFYPIHILILWYIYK